MFNRNLTMVFCRSFLKEVYGVEKLKFGGQMLARPRHKVSLPGAFFVGRNRKMEKYAFAFVYFGI